MNGPLILTYHSVADPVIEPALQVHPSTFVTHLRWLREAGYEIVDVENLCRSALDGKEVSHLVALTFDDGYIDFAQRALPCLVSEGGGPVTLFVCPEHVGQQTDWNYRSRVALQHLDLPALRSVVDAGVRLGAHGWNHRNFCQLPPDQLASQLDGSQSWFVEHFDFAPRLLAFPYGDYRKDHLPIVGARFDFCFAVGDGCGFSDRRAISRRCVSEFTTREKLLSPLTRARRVGEFKNVQRIS